MGSYMAQKSAETKNLVRKIKKREQFLVRVVTGVIALVQKHGTLKSSERGGSHIRTIKELCNFGNFTFETDLGQTDFGGNTISVWYHPGKIFREGGSDSAHDKKLTLVLDVYYQTHYEVNEFYEKPNWQKAIIRVFKNQDKIAEQIKRVQNRSVEKLLEQRQEEDRKFELVEKAKRLGIIPR